MATTTKFGTFAGVYTPSVLTILGVIMYMRLGWVVGQAGLYAAIVIILVAHIISITTGLSISSIATDKKIKTGGIYYILSRSLGLPMGGSIGITLFVGTALSIALYIVGFSESFLGIQAISDFLGLQADITGIRIIGTLILVFLVIIAFISTSLAIKSQFIVLGAIGISILSIAAGFFFGDSTSIQTNYTGLAEGHVQLITIFAIFFPAVTGFTAGVAMSGDLKDPKTSIPRGTLYSILTGLIVYLALAIGLAYFVNRDTLINDVSFISKIAFWSWPVIAGIWGATLSSALGGILGAPRIMQAIAKDKIMPKILGKGYGKTNEPRNALIFTFVLAELGVLMGELDAIAEVVSMFYIAAYGFINLAFALESWANTDFRPSFKISRWVGIIGFIASFGVMLQLNPVAMLAAFVIMWLIYFILKRRELKSDFGDVWGSVWSSIVRTSLNKLSNKQLDEQNWSPNILLFSGGTKNRPHLIEFGKQLVGKYGFLSNFDLMVNKEGNSFQIQRQDQNIKDEDSSLNQGFFTRKQACTDVYSGIEQVAANYGFAGVEPNTVFFGWARNSENPKRYIQMIRNIQQLNLNIIMMDYDDEREYGKYKQIDVWWRGDGQNENFSLQLVKFILQSEQWNNALIRLIIVNPVNEMHQKIYQQAESILSSLRIEAEIKVINNQIDKRSFYDIVQIESVNSDLIFMGIEKVSDDRVEAYINRINKLCLNIGTVILSNASSNFHDMKVGLEENIKDDHRLDNFEIEIQSKIDENHIQFPKQVSIAAANRSYFRKLLDQNSFIKKNFLEPILKQEQEIIAEIKLLIAQNIEDIKQSIMGSSPDLVKKKLVHINSQFLMECNKIIKNTKDNRLDQGAKVIEDLISHLVKSLENNILNTPEEIQLQYTVADMQASVNDNFDIRWYKRWNRMLAKLGKKQFRYKLKYRNLLSQHLIKPNLDLHHNYLNFLGTFSIQNIADLRKYISDTDLIFQGFQNNSMDNYAELLTSKLDQLNKSFESGNGLLLQKTDSLTLKSIEKLNQLTSMMDANSLLDEEFNQKKAFRNISASFEPIAQYRKRNQMIQLNVVSLEINILNFSNKLKQIAHEIEGKITLALSDGLISNYDSFIAYLNQYKKDVIKNPDAKFEFDIESLNATIDQDYSERLINISIRKLKNATQNFPESVELFTEESDNLMGTSQYTELETMKISSTALLDYMIQSHFNGSIKAIIDEIPLKSAEYQNHLVDQYRLTSYSLNAGDLENTPSKADTIDSNGIIKMISSQLENLKNDRDEINRLKETYRLKIEERLQNSLNSIAIYPFIKAAGNLKQYIKQQQSKEHNNKIEKLFQLSKKWVQDQFAQTWYRQSQGIILTQEILESDNGNIYHNQSLRELYRKLHPAQKSFEKLPFYYRQLFLRRQNFMKEMWVNRENEMTKGLDSLDDYRNGIHGGILITGERFSGKSFFAQMLALEFTNHDQIITLSPPPSGSIDVNSFKSQLQTALNTKLTTERYFRELKGKTVVIIEDMELWWEKQSEGQAVILLIHELIRKYSNKVLFISTMNVHSYKIIDQVNHIENYYLNIIMMGAMDAKSLHEMIMKRHNTSGLKFIHKKKEQDHYHSWDYAILFNRYFKFSRGIPGIAIHAWINNIVDIQDKTIRIKYPDTYNLDSFEQLSSEQNWQLLLFVLHKNMTLDKFSRLANISKHESFLEIEKLLRKGLIYKTDNHVFRINILMHHMVIQHLQDNRLI